MERDAATITPLAVELYGANVMHDYPCGCKFRVLENGAYEQFVSPDCKFDRLKIGLETPKGYFYKGFML